MAMNGWRGAMRWIGLAVCLVPIVWMAISLLHAESYLTSEVPSKWNDGQVTSTLPGWTVALIPFLGCLVSAIVSVAGSLIAEPKRLPFVYWLSSGFGCMFLALWLGIYELGTASLNGVPAPSPNWFIAAPLLILLGVVPWAIARLGRSASPKRAPDADPVFADGGPDDRHAVWTGSAANRFMGLLAGLVALLTILIASLQGTQGDEAPIALTCIVGVVVFACILAFSAVYVAIDEVEVRVRFWWGLPRKRIPLAEITSADAWTTSMGEWGGLGYRVGARGIGFIIRGGPALEIISETSAFVVTVDDASKAADQIQRLLAHRRNKA